LKKIYFSSHKLPKQQSTSFWSQGILGINEENRWTITLLPLKVLMPWALGFFTYSSIKEHLTSIVGLEGNKSYNHQSLQLKNNGFWVWGGLVIANPSKISFSQLWTMSTFHMAWALLTETVFYFYRQVTFILLYWPTKHLWFQWHSFYVLS
jgi:hypothetical protein